MRFALCILPFLVSAGGQFLIDYDNDTFTMAGKPFRYVSGSMHYFRCPRELWRDRLRKLREAGLNAVSTYIEWSLHEPIPGSYDFGGDKNFTEFIEIAAQEDLYVIVRPGPYICAERDNGGLPPWLLRDRDIRLRTSDPRYTGPVEVWMGVLLAKLKPMLYGNGGPIIMVQVENEYGSYAACDQGYLLWLRDIFIQYVGDKAVLFTTDGAGQSYLKCGKINGVYATVDFGPSSNVTSAFEAQRAYEPRGPLVNSEYYPGWLTHWGEPRSVVDGAIVGSKLAEMLQMGANINFYMFHGGTNFGFTAGANFGDRYASDITSYDYDAPLTEAGDITTKYTIIQDVLSGLLPSKAGRHVSRPATTKVNYGDLSLTHIASMLSPRVKAILGKPSLSTYPSDFEELENYYGYVLYNTAVVPNITVNLSAENIRDRGFVLINGRSIKVLSRETKTHNVTISTGSSTGLSVLVENLGRINYGIYNNDTKGLGNVTLDGILQTGWSSISYPLDNVAGLLNCTAECTLGNGFRFYAARFVLDYNTTNTFLPDTFIDVSNLRKGLVYVNDHNLGRYWTPRGPQKSLYLPGIWLKKAPLENIIVVFDEEVNANTITVRFSESPIWNSRIRPKVILV